MNFTNFPDNPAVIDEFHKLPRQSCCYRWISQASQTILLLSMDFTSFPDNPAVIDGLHKLPRQSSCYRWISQASQRIQLLSMDFSNFPENPAVIDGFLKLSMSSFCNRCVPYTKCADLYMGSYTHRLYIQNFYNDCQLLNVYCYKLPPLPYKRNF